MGSLSDYAENEFLDHVLGTGALTTPAAVYLSLHTADPLDAGTGTECSGGSYARKAITFGAAASRAITQSAVVTFDEATGSWGTVTHWGIWDASTAGNLLAHGSLSASEAVASGNTPSIAASQVVITVSTGGCSDYLANAMLDHLFRATTYTQPTIYVAFGGVAITDSMTGGTIDECGMTGYAREACSGWDAAASGASANTALIDFGTLTSTGETMEALALVDNASTSAGNLLFYDNTVSQAIADGDTVQIPAGDYDVTLD